MADGTLDRGHRNARRALPERKADRVRLSHITRRGRGSVRVDMIDLVGLHAGIHQRVGDRSGRPCAFRDRGDRVVGIIRGREAEDLRKDRGTAGEGVAEFLEDQSGSALAKDEPGARGIEWAAGGTGIIVAVGGESAHRREPGRPHLLRGRLNRAGNHDRSPPLAHIEERLTDCLCPGRAGCGQRQARASHTPAGLDVVRGKIVREGDMEVRGNPALAVFLVLVPGGEVVILGSTHAGADHRTSLGEIAQRLQVRTDQPRLHQRIRRGLDHQVGEARRIACDLSGQHALRDAGIVDIAAEQTGVFALNQVGGSADPGVAIEDALPRVLHSRGK